MRSEMLTMIYDKNFTSNTNAFPTLNKKSLPIQNVGNCKININLSQNLYVIYLRKKFLLILSLRCTLVICDFKSIMARVSI